MGYWEGEFQRALANSQYTKLVEFILFKLNPVSDDMGRLEDNLGSIDQQSQMKTGHQLHTVLQQATYSMGWNCRYNVRGEEEDFSILSILILNASK